MVRHARTARAISALTVVLAVCGGNAAQAAAAPPINDDLANGIVLQGTSISGSVSNVEATTESDEPTGGGVVANTVWYRWVAPDDGMLSVDVCNFDKALYRGAEATYATIEPVNAADVDGCTFKYVVANGETYHLQLGHNAMFGAGGTISFTITYANEFPLKVSKGTSTGHGSVESSPAGIACDLRCTSDSEVYAGGAEVTLTATAASTSRFDGWTGGGCDTFGTNPCVVTMDQVRSVTAMFTRVSGPANDNFVDGQIVGDGALTASNVDATTEPGEPTDNGMLSSTVWYRYTPASNGLLDVSTCGSDFSAVARVFTGSGVDGLTPITASTFGGCPSGNGYGVKSGTTYHIQVAGHWGGIGTFDLTLALVDSLPLALSKAGDGHGTVTSSPAGIDCGVMCTHQTTTFPIGGSVSLTATAPSTSRFDGWGGACAGTGSCVVTMSEAKTVTAYFTRVSGPANDDFADAEAVVAGSGAIATSNVDASLEPGEPETEMVGSTLWYRWTAPVEGDVTISTCGSAIQAIATPFHGTAVDALTVVTATRGACTAGTGGRVTWRAYAGRSYAIQVGGYWGVIGDLQVSVTFRDTVAPQTKITAKPRSLTTSRTATFKFKSSEPIGGKFQCKLDRGAWRKCSSPKTYRGLKRGYHTFQVRAIDKAGNKDKTAAKRTWRIK